MFKIEDINRLNDLEFSIYKFVVTHPKRVLDMKIRELADEVHVSTTTIIRFCRKVGCAGYSELKLRMKLNLDFDSNYEFNPRSMDALEYFQATDMCKLNEEVRALSKQILAHEHVIFLGLGSSGILAEYAARLISAHGKLCLPVKDSFSPFLSLERPKTLLVVFSVSGTTEDIVLLASDYKQTGNTLVALTNDANNPLAQLADNCITYNIPTQTQGASKISFTSQIPVLYIIETVACEISQSIKQVPLQNV